MTKNELSLNDWIIEVERILMDKYNTISTRIPLAQRPKAAWWEEGLSPEEAVGRVVTNSECPICHEPILSVEGARVTHGECLKNKLAEAEKPV